MEGFLDRFKIKYHQADNISPEKMSFIRYKDQLFDEIQNYSKNKLIKEPLSEIEKTIIND